MNPEINQRTLVATVSADKLRDLSDNAWDIGTVSGVLQGIALTPTLLPNQKEALAKARGAIGRIGARNHASVVAIATPLNNGVTNP